MKHLLKLSCLLLPFYSIAQVEVHKTNSSTIVNYLPTQISKSNIANLSNIPVITLSFTAPPIPSYGVPENLNIDSTYDDLDDSTYEYNPRLDYGVLIPTNITMQNGEWTTLNGIDVWRLKIVVNNALNTGINIDSFNLSPSAKFYIMNGDSTILKGPYVREAFNGIAQFGTFPMAGNSFYLLLYDSIATNISQNSLNIQQVIGGYQPVGDVDVDSSTLNVLDPLRCINSVRCYTEWMINARAIARWSNGAGSQCSGTLLNNENQNGISYFQSACHCLPADRNALIKAAFQFQFWQSGCNTGVNQPWIEFYGATLLHETSKQNGDAAFMQLNSGPGVGDAPTYAGWSRSNTNPEASNSGILHHPEGADMRFTKPKKVRDYWWNSSNYWKATYNDGVTRPGSSGSGLFNQNKQLIGTLTGGTSSCFWTFLGDRYGKFNSAWSGTGQFLSPVQNMQDITSLVLSPLQITGSPVICTQSTSYQYSLPNLVGCTYFWSSNNPSVQIIAGQGTATITVQLVSTPSNTTAWLTGVINDSKGSFPSGRRAETNIKITIGLPNAYTYTPYITQGNNTTYMSEFCNKLTYLCTNNFNDVEKSGTISSNILSPNNYCASGYITDPTATSITWCVAQTSSGSFHGYYNFIGNQFQVGINANYTSEWVILKCTRSNDCGSSDSYYKFYVTGQCVCPGLPYCEIITDPFTYKEKFTISPNPTNGQFNISLTSNDKNASIKEVIIKNKMGIAVFQKTFTNNQKQQTINLFSKTTDIYFIELYDGNEWTTQKLSLQR